MTQKKINAFVFADIGLEYIGIQDILNVSSPVPSTVTNPRSYEGLFVLDSKPFYAATVKRHKMKFKPARLVIPKKTSKDRRPFIKVYAPDYFSGNLKLKKIYKIPGKNISEKKNNAQQIINEINEALLKGAVFNRPVSEIKSETTLNEIINTYKESQKKSRSYGSRLNTALRPYIRFCESELSLNRSIKTINKTHGLKFLQHLKDKNISNRTINNYISYAKTVWIYANEISNQPVTSPFERIKKLPVENKRNVAYQAHDIVKIKRQHQLYPDLKFAAEFMYYSLIRTNELTLVQVRDIGLYKEDQLYVKASTSKNSVERHIVIPEPLRALIAKHRIKEYPPDYYVFSLVPGQGVKNKTLSPQPNSIRSSRLGERYRQYILNPLSYSLDYTFYSWKHTGVINAHNAGVPDADIMQQTGHKSYQSFTVYMKSLGLFARGRFAELIPKL